MEYYRFVNRLLGGAIPEEHFFNILSMHAELEYNPEEDDDYSFISDSDDDEEEREDPMEELNFYYVTHSVPKVPYIPTLRKD